MPGTSRKAKGSTNSDEWYRNDGILHNSAMEGDGRRPVERNEPRLAVRWQRVAQRPANGTACVSNRLWCGRSKFRRWVLPFHRTNRNPIGHSAGTSFRDWSPTEPFPKASAVHRGREGPNPWATAPRWEIEPYGRGRTTASSQSTKPARPLKGPPQFSAERYRTRTSDPHHPLDEQPSQRQSDPPGACPQPDETAGLFRVFRRDSVNDWKRQTKFRGGPARRMPAGPSNRPRPVRTRRRFESSSDRNARHQT